MTTNQVRVFFELAESAERTASGFPPALRELAKIGPFWRLRWRLASNSNEIEFHRRSALVGPRRI